MFNPRNIFFNHLAQTSPQPMAIEIIKSKGVYLFDTEHKKYLDAISGINVSYIGHNNKFVINHIKEQLKKFSHLMVYGELIQSPQVRYATLLCEHLPNTLNNIYFTNSGSEAVEAALKLAKRTTHRTKIISFKKSYHGSTHGALSVMGDEYWRNAYRPLLPNIVQLEFNDYETLTHIDNNTACVIMEIIQAEKGIIKPDKKWLQAISEKCKITNTLLIADEIQSGFGRTGKLWAFEHFDIVPDILLLGKALGGGLPLGAVITNKQTMNNFSHNPILGHITTFGGNAIACQAGWASFTYFLDNKILHQQTQKIFLLSTLLNNIVSKSSHSINQFGLWASIQLSSHEQCLQVVNACIDKGLFIDWFLFANDSLRISPPLTTTDKELRKIFNILNQVLHKI